MVVMDYLKRIFNAALPYQLYFYRDSNGNEADLLIDKGRSLSAFEIKMTRTVRAEHAKGLLRLPSALPVDQRCVISMTPGTFQIARGVRALPWWEAIQKKSL
jgi:predicted AAA+ superfamily ATPase